MQASGSGLTLVLPPSLISLENLEQIELGPLTYYDVLITEL